MAKLKRLFSTNAPGNALDRPRQLRQKRAGQLGRPERRGDRPARIESHFSAVDPARAQPQRLEQAIKFTDWTAADQGERAGKLAFGPAAEW